MTPMHHVNESFVIQPHCKMNMVHSHCGTHNHECCHNHQSVNITSVDDCSHLYGPSIEDRLENTEKLIREMSHKFEDIASTKHSAKNEFNKLVQTLTMNSALQDYQADSDTDSADISNNSSFDEETLNMNQQNLKNYFSKRMREEQKEEDLKETKQSYYDINRSRRNQHPEKAQFSNSRYDNVDEDEFDQVYHQKDPNYAAQGNNQYYEEEVDESFSDQLYENAKNTINRRKVLMVTSEEGKHKIFSF